MREDELAREYDTMMERLNERTAKVRERKRVLLEDLPTLSADASSSDGAVTVSVNADGLLTGLRLAESVASMPPAEVAEIVLRTYATAQADVARRAGDLLAPSLGERGYIAAQFRRREEFLPDYEAAAQPKSQASAAVDDDEEFEFEYGRSSDGRGWRG